LRPSATRLAGPGVAHAADGTRGEFVPNRQGSCAGSRHTAMNEAGDHEATTVQLLARPPIAQSAIARIDDHAVAQVSPLNGLSDEPTELLGAVHKFTIR